MPRISSLLSTGVACLAVAMLVLLICRPLLWDDSAPPRLDFSTAQPSTAQAPTSGTDLRNSDAPQYAVLINKPAGPPRIELAGADPQGRTASVACSTCHSVRPPNPTNVSAATLNEFHQGMTFKHGTIACYACHNPDDSNSLRLADGSSVAFENVMTLCSQCHGPQATAFAHGAHGGMNGFWDLTRGPQTKNNCVDCHDPHAPSYPQMIVGFKPKDRFNQPAEHDQNHPGADSYDEH